MLRRKSVAVREAPFRIFALLLNRTLGEFVDLNIFAAHYKSLFDNAELFVYYRDDRPYKSKIIEINPYIDRVFSVRDRVVYPLDFFDIAGGPPVKHARSLWYDQNIAAPDLLITPSMMDNMKLGRLRPSARLRVPPKQAEWAERRLVELGLMRDRWFCTIHYREPGYQYRPDKSGRDHDPAKFEALASRIIDELGGQVVRIGHPEMMPFAQREGLVDLARLEDGFGLQVAAVSRARFHLATPSGTATLACALGTPHAHVCDISSDNTVLYGEHDVILPSHFLSPEGHRIPARALFSRLFRADQRKQILEARHGFKIVHNSLEELLAMVRHMLVYTEGHCIDGWREPSTLVAGPRPNRVTLPLELGDFYTPFVEFPELAPAGPMAIMPDLSEDLLPVRIADRLDGSWAG